MEIISQFSNTVYVQSFYIHVRDEIKDKKMNARDTLEQRREIDFLDNHRGQLEAKPKKKYKLGG